MRLLNWGHLNLNGSIFKDASSSRGACVHVFLFVYLKHGCLGFLRNAECVISLPRLWRMPRDTRWPWRTAVHVYSPPWPSRLGGHEQSATYISVERPIVSSCESLSGLDSPPGHPCVHATQSSPPPPCLGTEFSCICLHSCQTVWAHSHDEFTPPCSYLYVRVIFITVVYVSRNSHWGSNFWYLISHFR